MKFGRIFNGIVQDARRSNSFFGIERNSHMIIKTKMSDGSKYILKSTTNKALPSNLALPAIRRHGTNQLLVANEFPPMLKRGICAMINPRVSALRGTLSTKQTPDIQQVRLKRSKCAEWCGTEPCDLPRKETYEKPSMWISPNCYNKLTCAEVERYDIIHMPGSNKETREYQQTWVECPPLRIVPKVVCCYETKMPPICKRPRKVRPATADYCQTHNECKIKNTQCTKIGPLPCCKNVRDPPKCKIYPSASCCHKRCTPFPSFSECCRPESNKQRPMECLCLNMPTQCELNDYRRRY